MYEMFPALTKIAMFYQGDRYLWPMVVYEQFIHLTQITLCPNIQLLSTWQQHAIQSYFSYLLVLYRLQ